MEELFKAMENQMVKEFRILQQLVDITKLERESLADVFAEKLMGIVEKKEAVLDDLVKNEDNFRMIMDQVTESIGIGSAEIKISDLYKYMEKDMADRFANLQEGILAILFELRSLTSDNLTMANFGIERTDSLQSFLVDMFNKGGENSSALQAYDADTMGWELDQRV